MGCNSSSPGTKEAAGPSAYLTESQGEAVLPSGSRRPSYWRNHSSNLDDGFDDKFDVASENADATAFVDRLLRECSSKDPSSYAITKILRVEDSAMWRRYQQSKTELSRRRGGKCVPAMDVAASRGQVTTKALIRASAAQEASLSSLSSSSSSSSSSSAAAARFLANLDLQVNEYYLWHGTNRSAFEAIAEDGFLFDEERAHSGRYGPGIYFAEDSAKSLEYSCEKDGTVLPEKCMLLCRVCFGEFHLTNELADDNAAAVARAMDRDSLLAAADGEPREFIVFDPARVYPEYALVIDTEGDTEHY
jgi:hypothetical protein